jgi:general L-amino acid transport system substrate-binding protein
MKFAKMDDVFKAYDGGQCDVLTTDVSRLYALRLKLSGGARAAAARSRVSER